MSAGYRVSVVGATGNVGSVMLEVLAERKFPVSEVIALASRSSQDKEVSYGFKKTLKVQALESYDFSKDDIVLCSAGSEVSQDYHKKITSGGAVMIDNASFFRMHEDVPLVIPEVNPDALLGYSKMNIVANPNCSTIQMLVALKPLHSKYKIKRIVVSTYQAVSGAGKAAADELYHQTKAMFTPEASYPAKEFYKQIAFNCVPQVGAFLEDGTTEEEQKVVLETKKILDQSIEVSATAVRVPVFNCHAESVNVEFEQRPDILTIKEILEGAPGVLVIDKKTNGGYATQAEYSATDSVYVSRIRADSSRPNTINMWIVADNVRKGAALNAVQIAEELIKRKLLQPKKK